ncbi:MAG: hypothetical protein AAB421_01195 [Patescibacteria group bacterium]
MIHKSWILGGVTALSLLLVTSVHAAPKTELHIKADGTIVATNVVVRQKSGSNLFSRMTWGEAVYARLVVLTKDTTVVTKAYGERATKDDIREGDVLDVEGKLVGADGSITIDATSVRDHSLLKESKVISGIVKSIDGSAHSFILPNAEFKDTTVMVTSTTTIQKGARSIGFGELTPGSKIISVSGVYSYPTNTLSAMHVEVHQDKLIFTPKNFQGKLKEIIGTSLPTTLVVTVEGTDYTVYLSATTSVLNGAKAKTTLSRYELGDTVRFYGAIRPVNLSEIDAEIVRDIDF